MFYNSKKAWFNVAFVELNADMFSPCNIDKVLPTKRNCLRKNNKKMIYYTFQKCSPFSFSSDNSHKKNRILIYELFWSKWTTYILRISILKIVIYENCIRFFLSIIIGVNLVGLRNTQQNVRWWELLIFDTFYCFQTKIRNFLYLHS